MSGGKRPRGRIGWPFVATLALMVGLACGPGPTTTPRGRSEAGVVLWMLEEACGVSVPASLEAALALPPLPADAQPDRLVVWGEPPATDAPFVRDDTVHAAWAVVQGRLYRLAAADYARWRDRCGDGQLSCARFAILEFQGERAVAQRDLYLAPLAGVGERFTLRWQEGHWEILTREVMWIS